jgi:hypothetical protein
MQSAKPSGLRPPTKVQIPSAIGLSEISASENNVRASAAMPAPALPNGLKHKPASRKLLKRSRRPPVPQNHVLNPIAVVYEPDPKRKTLKERGGEPIRSNAAAPLASKQASNLARSSSQRSNNLSASTSRMPTGPVSRLPSNVSSHSAIGRVASGTNTRPQSAMAHMRTQSHNNIGRPITSLNNRGTMPTAAHPVQPPTAGQSPGIAIPFRNASAPLKLSKRQQPSHQLSSTPRVASLHNSRTRSKLSAATHTPIQISEQPAINGISRVTSLSSAFQKISLVTTDESVDGNRELSQIPSTPLLKKSQLPLPTPRKLSPEPAQFHNIPSFRPPPLSPPKSPTKSRPPSPNKEIVRFLNKDSNIPALEWDGQTLDKRLENMESMIATFRDTMGGTTFERKGLMDVIELLKAKSIFLCLLPISTLRTDIYGQMPNWMRVGTP